MACVATFSAGAAFAADAPASTPSPTPRPRDPAEAWERNWSRTLENLAQQVDPRIGVWSGSSTVGPSLPFGSIHPGPTTPKGGHDGYNAYQPIRGFSQLHVSGTGWGQYGNLLISPQIGLAIAPDGHDSPKSAERAEAFQYRVRLDRYDIAAEVAPARHAAIYRFTFPKSDEAHIAFDLAHSIPGDIEPRIIQAERVQPTGAGSVTISADGRSLSGQRLYRGGFGKRPYTVYFYAELDRAPTAVGVWQGEVVKAGERTLSTTTDGERMGAFLRYATTAGETVQLRLAVSFRSVERAREHLRAEIPEWNYAGVRDAAEKAWNQALGAIAIRTFDDTQRTMFYTALFRCMTMPRDRTGEFERFDPNAPMWDDHLAVWDTWRTLYPLLSMIRPDVVRDTVRSFIERQRVDGAVGDTMVAGGKNLVEQGGNDVDNVIGEAFAKEIPGFDRQAAYAVMKFNADQRREGRPPKLSADLAPDARASEQKLYAEHYRKHGWIPVSQMDASNTLAYAYNDFVTAQAAESLGLKDDAKAYYERSKKWQHLWNADAESGGFRGFIIPRKVDGSWEPLDPKQPIGSWKPYFYEANSWTYSLFVPHQLGRVVELSGGPEQMTRRLEHGFRNRLVGISNEPAFLAPAVLHHAGRPDEGSKWFNHVLDRHFTRQGYPGDEDSGAMGSYFVWVTIGLFPNAGQDFYYILRPRVSETVITRPDDGKLTIRRVGDGPVVTRAELNGKPLERAWVRHRELKGETTLTLYTGSEPSNWGRKELPPSLP